MFKIRIKPSWDGRKLLHGLEALDFMRDHNLQDRSDVRVSSYEICEATVSEDFARAHSDLFGKQSSYLVRIPFEALRRGDLIFDRENNMVKLKRDLPSDRVIGLWVQYRPERESTRSEVW